MSKIRTLLAGSLASILGLSKPQFAQAQTPVDTGNTCWPYAGETLQLLVKKSQLSILWWSIVRTATSFV